MASRAWVLLSLVVAALAAGAGPAGGEPAREPTSSFVGRPDPRLCPSPLCGGLWLTAVNGAAARCPDPAGRECYVTSTTIGSLPLSERRKAALSSLFTTGRALLTGRIAYGRVDGFPELGVLRVTKAWASASPPARGTFYLVRDNGIRCVKAPCPSQTATALNRERELRVTGVDVARVARADRRRARAALAAGEAVVLVGRVARPEANARVLVASRALVRWY